MTRLMMHLSLAATTPTTFSKACSKPPLLPCASQVRPLAMEQDYIDHIMDHARKTREAVRKYNRNLTGLPTQLTHIGDDFVQALTSVVGSVTHNRTDVENLSHLSQVMANNFQKAYAQHALPGGSTAPISV